MMQSFVLTIKKSPLLQGISWVFLSTSIASLLRFLLVFVVLHCYNQEQFGLWASITSIGAIIVTGDFGLTNVLRNIASKNLSRGKEGDDETKRYFFSTLYFFFFLALVLTLLLLLFNNAIPFEKLFKTSNKLLKYQGHIITSIVLIIFLFNIPLSISSAMFFSYGENKYNAIFTALSSFCSFVIVTCLSLYGISIIYVSVLYFLCPLLINVYASWLFIRRRKWINSRFSFKILFKDIKYLIPLGIRFLIIGFSSSFISNILTVYSGSMLGLKIAANVNVAQKIFVFFTNIYQSVLNPIWSRLSYLYFKADIRKCRILLGKSILTTCIVSFIIILCTTASCKFLINVIAGSQYKADFMLFFLIGCCLFLKVIFDNVSLLQIAINNVNVVAVGYLIFIFISFVVFPKIIKYYSFNIMMLVLIACWILFSYFIGYITYHKQLKLDD